MKPERLEKQRFEAFEKLYSRRMLKMQSVDIIINQKRLGGRIWGR